jgi:hypothetical protein
MYTMIHTFPRRLNQLTSYFHFLFIPRQMRTNWKVLFTKRFTTRTHH